MEPELFDMLADTITIEPPDGTYTDRGQPNFGASVSYPCHIEPVSGEQMIYGPSGEERKAAWRIHVGTTSALNPAGRLTLPTGFSPQQPPFYAVGRETDENSAHHMVILV